MNNPDTTALESPISREIGEREEMERLRQKIELLENRIAGLDNIRFAEEKGVVHRDDKGIVLELRQEEAEDSGMGGGGGGTRPGPLVIIQTDSDKIRVTWGTVNNIVPSNISTEATLTASRQVWLEITMQTVSPYKVVSAVIKAEAGGIPDPEPPDPVTGAPPEKLYYLLGEVTFASGAITNIENTNGLTGGSLGVTVQAIGSVCREAQPADPGDPEAEPPIPPTPAIEGGVVDMLAWVAWRDNGNG